VQIPLALLCAAGSQVGKLSKSGAARHIAKAVAAYGCAAAVVAGALLQLVDALQPPTAARLHHWLGLAGWRLSLPSSPLPGTDGAGSDPLAWVGWRVDQQPMHLRPSLLLPAASLQPGLGLHWYLMAQAFPRFRQAGVAVPSASAPTRSTLLLWKALPGRLPATPARSLVSANAPGTSST
jgi:hypothetical protein